MCTNPDLSQTLLDTHSDTRACSAVMTTLCHWPMTWAAVTGAQWRSLAAENRDCIAFLSPLSLFNKLAKSRSTSGAKGPKMGGLITSIYMWGLCVLVIIILFRRGALTPMPQRICISVSIISILRPVTTLNIMEELCFIDYIPLKFVLKVHIFNIRKVWPCDTSFSFPPLWLNTKLFSKSRQWVRKPLTFLYSSNTIYIKTKKTNIHYILMVRLKIMPPYLASRLQRKELKFTFLYFLAFQPENQHDLLVDNWTHEHPMLSIPLKLLLLL